MDAKAGGVNSAGTDAGGQEPAWIPLLDALDPVRAWTSRRHARRLPLRLSPSKADSSPKDASPECVLSGNTPEWTLELRLSLQAEHCLHVVAEIHPTRATKLHELRLDHAILLEKPPDFTWVPHVVPRDGLVIPDHVFRAPVMVYARGSHALALVPDLTIFRQARPTHDLQAFLDVDVRAPGHPRLTYGWGRLKPTGHILFKRRRYRSRVPVKPPADLSLGYHLLVFKDAPVARVLAAVNAFLWTHYGHPTLAAGFAPQVMPYAKNVAAALSAIFERQQLWGAFQIEGQPCGGIWFYTWQGRKKKPVQFFAPETVDWRTQQNVASLVDEDSFLGRVVMHFANKPFWIKRFDRFTRHHAIIQRNAEVWNNAWFMNLRTAYGIRYFGEMGDDAGLVDKATRMLNLVLSLPRAHGAFPTIVYPARDGERYATIKGVRGFQFVDAYNLVDCALVMYWANLHARDFGSAADRARVSRLSRALFELIARVQLPSGEVPVYLTFPGAGASPAIEPELTGSASSGAPLMFLAQYAAVAGDHAPLSVMKRIATYLEEHVLPDDKWHDFEPFYSCTHLPVDFYDERTASHVMNALCVYWCAEGFKGLYQLTDDPHYLAVGERVLATLSLFQQVWNMPHEGLNTFGGFAAQNADAELGDARQGLFVRVYAEYYLLTGIPEYMERAIATLRACWALQLVEENRAESPGLLGGIDTVAGVDRGLVSENYGHSGYDLRIPGYVMPDWGIGTAMSATAYMKRHFGDLFVDFRWRRVWGIDGFHVVESEVRANEVRVRLEQLSPASPRAVRVKSRGPLPADADESSLIHLIINGKDLGAFSLEQFREGFQCKVQK